MDLLESFDLTMSTVYENIVSSLQQLNSKVFIAHHNRNMRNIDEVYAFSVVHEDVLHV